MELIEIKSTFVTIDMIYAKNSNFTGKKIYPENRCFLLPLACEKLMIAVDQLKRIGYHVKICDAFRPLESQYILFEHMPDPKYIADPYNGGSSHSRAVAVDVTLIDENGDELDMGTAVDEFDIKSSVGNMDISPKSQRNRLILTGAMASAGWCINPNEWWHFQLPNAMEYPIITSKFADDIR